MIALRLLGAPSVTTDEFGREVGGLLARPKRLALFAYLAASTPSLHTRDKVASLFWPEADQEHARAALRKAVHLLRADLGESVVLTVGDDQLGCSSGVWCDVAEFDKALRVGDLAAALDLYRGDLLPSFFIPDSPGFERWLEEERTSLRAKAAGAAQGCAKAHEHGSLTEATRYARLALHYAPDDEPTLRWLISLLDQHGDRAGALRTYEQFADRLRRELEVEPSQETATLVGRIRDRPNAIAPPRQPSGDEAFQRLSGPASPAATSPRPFGVRRVPLLVGFGIAGVLLISGWGYATMTRLQGERWVRDRAIPEISRLAGDLAYDSAYALALRADKIHPNDSVLNSLWPRFARNIVFRTVPAGAQVRRARFADTSHWDLLGTTPTDSVRITPGSRIRFEKPGFHSVDRASILRGMFEQPVILDPLGAPNPEMVHVTGGEFDLVMPGLEHLGPLTLGPFQIDRHEVTNAAYQAFVAAGGYARREFWDREFIRDGHRLSFDEAMALMVDKTGRPGPATWEAGNPPPGQANLPVGGVSWYEAAAYAKFLGKSLPSVYHWIRAAHTNGSRWIVPGSNFSAPGPVPGDSLRGMGPFGTFDTAGNVREWCENVVENKRYILGGSWSDPSYSYTDPYAEVPFDRAPINGIRLVKYQNEDPNLELAGQPLVRARRDFWRERPAPDKVFETYRRFYDYDRTPLNAQVEPRRVTGQGWIREKVLFDAAYGGERMSAYLFLPTGRRPPFQTVILFPGLNLRMAASYGAFDPVDNQFDFFLSSGRAVLWPIYKSTFDRADSLGSDYANETIFYRDHVVMWAKDMRRSIDYLETRADIDTTRLAYFGWSWGGFLGGLMPALEPRFKAVVLYVAGLEMERARPEVDPLNFLPRIRMPVLMVNGKYDDNFATETSQRPMFNLLGTPPADKRWVLYEGGHFVPRTKLVTEALNWLDKYLGPVH